MACPYRWPRHARYDAGDRAIRNDLPAETSQPAAPPPAARRTGQSAAPSLAWCAMPIRWLAIAISCWHYMAVSLTPAKQRGNPI